MKKIYHWILCHKQNRHWYKIAGVVIRECIWCHKKQSKYYHKGGGYSWRNI